MNSLLYLDELLKKLNRLQKKEIGEHVFVGFDGYIDKIQKAVESRKKDKVTYYDSLTAFSNRIAVAAGKSGQVELVTQEIKIGGNAPIMATALSSLGIYNTCLGCAGYPKPLTEFKKLPELTHMLSIGNPAETNALEFSDGKMILSELTTFRKLDWAHIVSLIGKKTLKEKINEATVISLVGWCNPDHATNVWRGILTDIMPYAGEKKLIFFDLADPTKKSKSDLLEVLQVIRDYRKFGPVILGINENETLKLFTTIKMDYPDEEGLYESLEEKGQFLFGKLGISGILIHPIDRSIYIHGQEPLTLHAPLVREPRISTGGGDNFNAGFCLGYMLDFSIEESMILGMATSGSYVKYGISPSQESVAKYLKSWK